VLGRGEGKSLKGALDFTRSRGGKEIFLNGVRGEHKLYKRDLPKEIRSLGKGAGSNMIDQFALSAREGSQKI